MDTKERTTHLASVSLVSMVFAQCVTFFTGATAGAPRRARRVILLRFSTPVWAVSELEDSRMKRIAVFVLGVLGFSPGAFAQGGGGTPAPPPPLSPGASQEDVDKALLAAPANLKD